MEAIESVSNSETVLELPKDAWLHIFGLLSVKDRVCVLSSCGTLYRYLNDSKTLFLFEEVFPIIESRLEWCHIFLIRLVCKSWKRGVDSHWNQNHRRPFSELDSKLIRNGKYFFPRRLPFPRKLLPSEITKYCREMYLHPTNPFPGGIFQANFRQSDNGMRNFSLIMTPFLLRFGMFISHINFADHNPAGYIPSFVYQKIRILLCRMPHLKTFVFQITVAGSTVEDGREVASYVRDKQLPILPLLRVMDVNPVLISDRRTPQIRASIESLHLIQDKIVSRYGTNLGQLGVASFLWEKNFLGENTLQQITEIKFHGICSKERFAAFVKEVECGLNIPELIKLDLELSFNWQQVSKLKVTRFIQSVSGKCGKLQVVCIDGSYEHPIKFLVEKTGDEISLVAI